MSAAYDSITDILYSGGAVSDITANSWKMPLTAIQLPSPSPMNAKNRATSSGVTRLHERGISACSHLRPGPRLIAFEPRDFICTASLHEVFVEKVDAVALVTTALLSKWVAKSTSLHKYARVWSNRQANSETHQYISTPRSLIPSAATMPPPSSLGPSSASVTIHSRSRPPRILFTHPHPSINSHDPPPHLPTHQHPPPAVRSSLCGPRVLLSIPLSSTRRCLDVPRRAP